MVAISGPTCQPATNSTAFLIPLIYSVCVWVGVDKSSFFGKWVEHGFKNWTDIVWIASILNLLSMTLMWGGYC